MNTATSDAINKLADSFEKLASSIEASVETPSQKEVSLQQQPSLDFGSLSKSASTTGSAEADFLSWIVGG